MKITDDLLSAYLDDELPIEQRTQLEQDLASDHALSIRLYELEESNAILLETYSAIDNQPMPATILEEISEGDSDNIVHISKLRRFSSPNRWTLPLAASVALAVGLFGGTRLNQSSSDNNVEQIASILPGAPLHNFLEKAQSGETVDISKSAIGRVRLTFASGNNQICREYVIESTTQATQAVACRQPTGNWEVLLAARASTSENLDQGYSTASEEDQAFGLAVDQLIEGDPLDVAAEQKLIARRWNR